MECNDWNETRPGDTIDDLRIVARNIGRRTDARAIAESSGGSVCVDGPHGWAVWVHDHDKPTPAQTLWAETYARHRNQGASEPEARMLADAMAHQTEEGAA